MIICSSIPFLLEQNVANIDYSSMISCMFATMATHNFQSLLDVIFNPHDKTYCQEKTCSLSYFSVFRSFDFIPCYPGQDIVRVKIILHFLMLRISYLFISIFSQTSSLLTCFVDGILSITSFIANS